MAETIGPVLAAKSVPGIAFRACLSERRWIVQRQIHGDSHGGQDHHQSQDFKA
jgi:hypothetical protein